MKGEKTLTIKLQILSIVFSILLGLGVLEMARRKMIRTKYILFWLLMSFAFMTLSLFGGGFFILADVVGIYSPANAVFVVAFACVLLLLFNFSIIVSGLSCENRKLILKVSLLTWQVEQLEKEKVKG